MRSRIAAANPSASGEPSPAVLALRGEELDMVSGGARITEGSIGGTPYWTVDGWIRTFVRPSGDGVI